MKKLFLLLTIAAFAVGCAGSARLVNSATYSKPRAVQPVVAALYADLDVSPTKITFFYIPSKTVLVCGYDNVINTAVREALLANGDADVLVSMETQVKYNSVGEIESVIVSGYPARYVNFRNAGDEVLQTMSHDLEADNAAGGGLLGKIKLGGK